MESLKQKLEKAASYIQSVTKTKPFVGVVLGSGLGAFVDKIENKTANVSVTIMRSIRYSSCCELFIFKENLK